MDISTDKKILERKLNRTTRKIEFHKQQIEVHRKDVNDLSKKIAALEAKAEEAKNNESEKDTE